jgi:hypothetical protein
MKRKNKKQKPRLTLLTMGEDLISFLKRNPDLKGYVAMGAVNKKTRERWFQIVVNDKIKWVRLSDLMKYIKIEGFSLAESSNNRIYIFQEIPLKRPEKSEDEEENEKENEK